MNKKFVVSALAASSLNAFAGDTLDLQKAALDQVFQKSNSHFICEYENHGWLTGALKSKTKLEFDLESKTMLAVTRKTDGTIESKKTFELVIWRKDGDDTVSIYAKTASSERPEVSLGEYDAGSMKMDLRLELLNGKREYTSIQCK